MTRIVDVAEFLRLYPFAPGVRPFHFVVTEIGRASCRERV